MEWVLRGFLLAAIVAVTVFLFVAGWRRFQEFQQFREREVQLVERISAQRTGGGGGIRLSSRRSCGTAWAMCGTRSCSSASRNRGRNRRERGRSPEGGAPSVFSSRSTGAGEPTWGAWT